MAKQERMTQEECLKILEQLDCGRSEADIDECKDMLREALLSKSTSPPVMSPFLLQMYIALDELHAANKSAKHSGMTLIHDGQQRSGVIDMYEAEKELSRLTYKLATGDTMMQDTGYPDYRKKGLIIIEGLCHAVLVFNKTCDQFRYMGFEMTENVFKGHYYKALNACIKAIELLCQTPTTADDVHVKVNTILERLQVIDYRNRASDLFGEYSDVIAEHLEELEGISDNNPRMFNIPIPLGNIRAMESMDKDNPGIVLFFYDKKGKEHASCLMEYNQNKETVLLHVWGPNDPDGDPIYTIDMNNKETDNAG